MSWNDMKDVGLGFAIRGVVILLMFMQSLQADVDFLMEEQESENASHNPN